MTLVTDKATILTALTDYREVEQMFDLTKGEQSSAFDHMCFTFRLGEPQITEITNKNFLSSNRIILDIIYRINKDNSFESNYDLFTSVYNVLRVLSGYANILAVSFDRHPDSNKHCLGKLEFYYGHRMGS